MHLWLEPYLRTLLERRGRAEDGQAELLIIVLIAFLIALLVSGRRIVVQ